MSPKPWILKELLKVHQYLTGHNRRYSNYILMAKQDKRKLSDRDYDMAQELIRLGRSLRDLQERSDGQ